jgi:hypothetical protein
MATAASKRTSGKSTTHVGGSSTSNGRHSDAVRELLVHGTRVQLATLTSVSKFFVGWTQSADRYAQAVSDELLRRAQGETAPHELLGRLITVSSRHLREVTALPTDVVSHFNSELAKQTKPRQRQSARRQAAS